MPDSRAVIAMSMSYVPMNSAGCASLYSGVITSEEVFRWAIPPSAPMSDSRVVIAMRISYILAKVG